MFCQLVLVNHFAMFFWLWADYTQQVVDVGTSSSLLPEHSDFFCQWYIHNTVDYYTKFYNVSMVTVIRHPLCGHAIATPIAYQSFRWLQAHSPDPSLLSFSLSNLLLFVEWSRRVWERDYWVSTTKKPDASPCSGCGWGWD